MKNTVGHMTVLNFLIAVLLPMNVLSQSLQQELSVAANNQDRSKIVAKPYELFARQNVTNAGNIFTFLDNTVDKTQGICNVHNGKLPSNSAFVFNQIFVGYSTNAAEKLEGGVLYNSAAPASLRNAEFVIKQNGREVINLPVASLNNRNTGTTAEDDFMTLGSLAYLVDDTAMEWEFRFAGGQTVTSGTDQCYAEVRLRGWITEKKAG